MLAGSGLWFNESGEWSAKGWKPATFANETPRWLRSDLRPYQDAINQLIANMKKASESYSIKQPVRWVTAADAMELTSDQLELYYGIGVKPDAWGNWAVTLPGSKSTNNERSKPMGLTKEHEYKNVTDGRKLSIEKSADDHRSAYIHVNDESDGVGIWLDYADTVPLALNVLGYDRPGAGDGSSVSADGFFVPGIRIQGDAQRAELAAKAISYLKSVDIYDQQAAERKATEEAKKAHDAKREADLEAARINVAIHAANVADYGVTAARAEKLADAAAKYKAAFDAHASV